MKFSFNMVFQAIALIAQVLNQVAEIVPDESKGLVVAVVATLQGIVALLAHFANPDGSKITTAYVPKNKKLKA